MADKYHINPATGRPGKCSATHQCRFGGDKNHFPSKEAAQKAIEKAPEGLKHIAPLFHTAEEVEELKYNTFGSMTFVSDWDRAWPKYPL